MHWNVKKLDESLWNGLIWHRIRKYDMCTEHGKEKKGSVKKWESTSLVQELNFRKSRSVKFTVTLGDRQTDRHNEANTGLRDFFRTCIIKCG